MLFTCSSNQCSCTWRRIFFRRNSSCHRCGKTLTSLHFCRCPHYPRFPSEHMHWGSSRRFGRSPRSRRSPRTHRCTRRFHPSERTHRGPPRCLSNSGDLSNSGALLNSGRIHWRRTGCGARVVLCFLAQWAEIC
jgi:hypothetical protein